LGRPLLGADLDFCGPRSLLLTGVSESEIDHFVMAITAAIDHFVMAITAAEAKFGRLLLMDTACCGELTGENSGAQDKLVRRCRHFVRDEFRNMGGLDVHPLPLKSKINSQTGHTPFCVLNCANAEALNVHVGGSHGCGNPWCVCLA
jgi:hypothetical protein